MSSNWAQCSPRVATTWNGSPDTVRAPDVSFISAERLPPDEFPHGYPTLAPDLTVEVLSPSERPGARREKMQDYFAAGTRLVWEIDPAQPTITAYRCRTRRDHARGRRRVDRR